MYHSSRRAHTKPVVDSQMYLQDPTVHPTGSHWYQVGLWYIPLDPTGIMCDSTSTGTLVSNMGPSIPQYILLDPISVVTQSHEVLMSIPYIAWDSGIPWFIPLDPNSLHTLSPICPSRTKCTMGLWDPTVHSTGSQLTPCT